MGVRKLTLDNNCILNLENDLEPMASAMRSLMNMHSTGHICLRVSCVTGFERPRSGSDHVPYIEEFRDLLASVGLGEVEILPSIFSLDTGYRLDSGFFFGDDADFALEQRIHCTLFPSDGDGSWEDFVAVHSDWNDEQRERNWKKHKQDSLTMWGHIYHGGDVFVTSDHHFHKKATALIALGARSIMTPQDALSHAQAQEESGWGSDGGRR